jgi:hypothetical protein
MSNLTELNYDEAHKFVEKNKFRGFKWNGWDIIKWTKNSNGYFQTNGKFSDNEWGYETRIPLTENGTWKVLTKYV